MTTDIETHADQIADTRDHFRNRILHGDCANILRTLPEGSADLVVTDPPYLVGYRDRSGRTIAGDNDPDSVLGAFPAMYRALKPDSFCICFYGWNRIELFMTAWKNAGFAPVGHLVWHKGYASRIGYLRACHEQAFLLAKGRPNRPAAPLDDVLDWEYSGNRWHPTEKAVSVIRPLIETFSQPGDLVLDPFAGAGSTAVASTFLDRDYLGIELEEKYCTHARRRLAGVARYRDRRAAA